MSIQSKYEKFRWYAEWLEYADKLPDEEERTFNRSVIRYGLMKEEPAKLTGSTLDYFNTHIRPELDRQHKRLDRGLWI